MDGQKQSRLKRIAAAAAAVFATVVISYELGVFNGKNEAPQSPSETSEPQHNTEPQTPDNLYARKLIRETAKTMTTEQKKMFLGQIVYHLHGSVGEILLDRSNHQQRLSSQYTLGFNEEKKLFTVAIKSSGVSFEYPQSQIEEAIQEEKHYSSDKEKILNQWKEASKPQPPEQQAKNEDEIERMEVLQQAMLAKQNAILDIYDGKEGLKKYQFSGKDGNLQVEAKNLKKTFSYTPQEVEQGLEAYLTYNEEAKDSFRQILQGAPAFPTAQNSPQNQHDLGNKTNIQGNTGR